jgi:hypothetical protein
VAQLEFLGRSVAQLEFLGRSVAQPEFLGRSVALTRNSSPSRLRAVEETLKWSGAWGIVSAVAIVRPCSVSALRGSMY